jgi:ribosomal peptide maturation radical SAM protein 1
LIFGAGRDMAEPLDVALVVMPFGPLQIPSIGLGLLHSAVARRGFRTRTFYFSFLFAKLIGTRFYDEASDGEPARQDLVGEWIFSGTLFDQKPAAVEDYLDQVLRGRSAHHVTSRNGRWYEQLRGQPNKGVSDAWISQVLCARSLASEYLDSCVAELVARSPRIVGLTSMFEQHVPALALAKRLRVALPDTFIVIGGSNCEGPMGRETAQSFPFLDAVVSGEGDAIFPTIVEHVQLGTEMPPIKGLYLRTGPGRATLRDPPSEIADPIRNLDDLPYPDYSDYFDQLGRSGIRFDGITPPHLVFETARGCWWGQRHHCTFCGLNGSTMAFRSKTPERALAELETLVKTYGDYPISVSDNILDQGYLRTFVPALKARTLGAKLFYEVKANLKKNDLRSLRDAGIDKIQPGIESFSTKVLKEMRKGISGIQNVQLLKWCCELGLIPVWGILWGFPQEQPSDYAEMADLIPSLTHLTPPIGITPIRLDRFSPNFVNAAAGLAHSS